MSWRRKKQVGKTLVRVAGPLDKAGHIAQQPPVWAGLTAALACLGGEKGRQAALRGAVSYLGAAVLANLVVKPLVRRPRPRKAKKGVGPVTSSFPSGHGATHVAFVFASTQEMPVLFPPLAATALVAHWSIIRSRGHFPSDLLIGGFMGLGVALAVRKLWPQPPEPPDDSDTGPPSRLQPAG